jgi:hypothetical protein
MVSIPHFNSDSSCGTHIHEGQSCANAESQGVHLYSGLEVDPWLTVGYLTTDSQGSATFVDCLETGVETFDGRAFIIHNSAGGRVSCGLLEAHDHDEPAPAPDSSALTHYIVRSILLHLYFLLFYLHS